MVSSCMNNQEILENIRLLASNWQPREDISDLLYRHGCLYLLSKMKDTAYTKKIQVEFTLNKICVRERYKTCKPIFDGFQSSGISFAVIKGAALSLSAYGDVVYRKSGDIDLIISHDNIDTVKKIMIDNGFIQGRVTDSGIEPFSRRELIFQSSMSHQAAPFIKKTDNLLCPYVNVDVNTDVLWGESKRKADMDFVLSHIEKAVICDYIIQKLSPEMEFVALCLHHYKDMNSIYLLSKGSLKLSLFCDIYYYIKNCVLDTDKLRNICERLKVTEFVYYCLYYTNLVFSDSALSPLLAALKTEKAESIMNTFGLADDEIKEWGISFPERLFDGNIQQYFDVHLTAKEIEKININSAMM